MTQTRLVTALLLAASLFVTGACGDDDSGSPASQSVSAPKKALPDYAGAVATPPKAAPPLDLEDSNGKRFDIAAQRGKVVLVTFVYINCPDVCPLIVSNFKVAQAKLGPKAKSVEFVAVSVDPERDKPRAVNEFLEKRGMKGRMHYLLGSSRELGRAWKSWGIVAEPAASNPELIEHASPIYGVSARGRITTLYPANFKPQQIVQDVPLLAER